MNLNLITVVIPSYNRKTILGRTLDSVLNQTYSNLEVIIVDDNSDDGTYELFSSHEDKRVKVVKHQINKGGASARNTGIRMAKGEFIAFLDSDDEWVKDKVEKQLKHFEKVGDDNTILFAQIAIDKIEGAKLLPKNNNFNKQEHISEYLFLKNGLISTDLLFMKTKLAKEIMFTEKLMRHQDYDFVLHAFSKEKKFEYLHEALAVWHTLGDDRMGKRIDYEYSYAWAYKNKELFTKDALIGFILKDVVSEVIRSKFSHKGLKFLIKLYQNNDITFTQLLVNGMRIFMINPKSRLIKKMNKIKTK